MTDYTYDAAGELLTTTTGAGTATAATTSNCYDPDGDKTATVARRRQHVLGCRLRDLVALSDLVAYQTGYAYDSLGELVSQTRPRPVPPPMGR